MQHPQGAGLAGRLRQGADIAGVVPGRRQDVEAESRTPARLDEFRARARHELGAAGVPLLADKTEQLRKRWVLYEEDVN